MKFTEISWKMKLLIIGIAVGIVVIAVAYFILSSPFISNGEFADLNSVQKATQPLPDANVFNTTNPFYKNPFG